MGFNVRFDFPKIPYSCDDARLFEFMEAHGGSVFQGGGYPGAPLYVIFDGVKDRESADKKIKAILPALTKLASSL
jgi:hypothetical protein